MKDKDIKTNFSKVCGLAYNFKDIKRIIVFSQKHNYKWYYITHRDLDENLNEKKLHYHFIIESDSSHRFVIRSLLTDSFGINLFEKCNNVGAYLRYMLHIDYDFKKHYELKHIKSNVVSDKINELVNTSNLSKQEISDNNFNEVMLWIFQMLDLGSRISLRDVIQYCIDNDIQYKSSWSFTIKNLLS